MHTVSNGAGQPLAMWLWPCSLDGTSVQLSACDVSDTRSVGGKANQSEAAGKMLIPQCLMLPLTLVLKESSGVSMDYNRTIIKGPREPHTYTYHILTCDIHMSSDRRPQVRRSRDFCHTFQFLSAVHLSCTKLPRYELNLVVDLL